MIPTNLSPVANHLWQSSLFAAAVWLLTFALQKNRAAVRYWLWLAASVKFLIPFSWLVSIGSLLGWRTGPALGEARWTLVVDDISRPFAAPVSTLQAVAPRASDPIPSILFAVWIAGCAAGVVLWVRCWRQIRAARRGARPLALDVPIPVLSSPAGLEPGVFGILKPVLLLPDGITERLSPTQMETILAHELCHVRRRDNLTAAIHMVVETVFWFYPLVWWMRARLMEERERACDEEVLRSAKNPDVYAEGILNVCRFYLNAPRICVSGITGADLKKRIADIVAHRAAERLDWRRRLLLVAAGVAALAGPILIGAARAPAAQSQAESKAQAALQAQAGARLEFDVASIKANTSGRAGYDGFEVVHGSLTVRNVSLRMLVERAYGMQGARILGGPAWAGSDRFDVVAKGPVSATKEQVWLMLRSLLADRFKVEMRSETKELPLYALEVGKGGPKLPKRDGDCRPAADPASHLFVPPCGGAARVWGPQGGVMIGQRMSMSGIASGISGIVDRPVVDRTGLTGAFDLELRWTPDGYQFAGASTEERGAARPAEAGPSLLAAIQEQLGLKLVATKGPVEMLVIVRAEKPSEN